MNEPRRRQRRNRAVHPERHEARVYFAQAPDGLIKIGLSTNIGQRLLNLQTETKTTLVLLGSVPGSGWTEADWHDYFIDLHAHGEWFRSDARLLAAIAEALAAQKTPERLHIPWGTGRPSLRALRARQGRLRNKRIVHIPGEWATVGGAVPVAHRDALQQIAQANNTTVAFIIRELIAAYLRGVPITEAVS